jgi:hypothetical protein
MRIQSKSVDITPIGPTSLGGYLGTNRSGAVRELLEANLLALKDSNDEVTLIVSLDLLYPGRIVRSALTDAAPSLRDDQLFLAASHTHSAPMTDDTKPTIGYADPEYLEFLCDKLTSATRSMLESPHWVDGSVRAGSTEAHHSINRRSKRGIVVSPPAIRLNQYVMAPNAYGATDETVTAMLLVSAGGKPAAIVWNYACHPVSYPESREVAAHFPHVVREVLRAKFSMPGLPVLFLQGFSGNTRPSSSVRVPNNLFERALRRKRFGVMSHELYMSWAGSLASFVASACESAQPSRGNRINSARSVLSSRSLVLGGNERPVSFHSLGFGPDISIVGVSAEVVAEYAPIVRKMAQTTNVMCVGCIDDTFGYAPTSKIAAEGGYEGGGFCEPFGLGGLSDDLEARMMAGFGSVT